MIWKIFIISFVTDTRLFEYISRINMMNSNSVKNYDLYNGNQSKKMNLEDESDPIQKVFKGSNIPFYKQGRDERYDSLYFDKNKGKFLFDFHTHLIKMDLLKKLEQNNTSVQDKLIAIREYNKVYEDRNEFISNIKAGMLLADW
jgi:hypothetical protein